MEEKTMSYEKFGDVAFYRDDESRHTEHWSFPALDTSSALLKQGQVCKEGARPLFCDMIYDKDTPIVLRDGTAIYGDVFRPAHDGERYPLLLVWTPYGKIDPPNNYSLYYNHANLDPAMSCGLATMEGPEPDYWVLNGYAVAVVDSRGGTNSEGDMRYFGYQEGLDVCDTIEQLAEKPWCSGAVGMMGNSWLAICQYFAAAQQPPHLKAIAPWEGLSDLLRDCLCRGGIPTPEFALGINSMMRYGSMIENVYAMLQKYPGPNAYWDEEKRPDFSKITLPAYFVASWDSNIHPYGTLRAWNKIASKEKWLRIHNTQEWYDQQSPGYRDELRRFFDYYLKGCKNSWPNTPRVRLSLLDATGSDLVNQAEEDFPIPRIQYKTWYLDASNMELSDQIPPADASHSYAASDGAGTMAQFRFRVTRKMLACGYFKMKLYVSTSEGDDMDLFAYVNKEDSSGVPHFHPMLNCKFMGAEARIRVSCRRILQDDRCDFMHDLTNPQLLAPGEIAEVETVFWPMGMVWHEDEIVVLTVSSQNLREIEFPTPPVKTVNQGSHTIYTGPSHPSCLEIPVV